MSRPRRPRRGDVEFTATVRAAEITFHTRPETSVDFPGEGGRESASGADCTNLPAPVAPGTTYRDVEVDYRLASRLTGEDEPEDSEAPPDDGPP
ncbi:hypothetical protein [Allonocardiopsis opalescens]|uniref:Uncharacterized protein n=1 Tax=Allonocardiopsis opalescens TaxID=1144618 RepID=A0A2T0Q2E6_9ACTN|nr:hypothetical protein [Allonocardiopsis opalescens]PRX97971.1 hypothetical protein CLV72_105324 [Allonocardiopsis opalescens]